MACVNCDDDKIVAAVAVWYEDGPKDGCGDAWSSLPDDGVQAVVLTYLDGTRRILSGNDFYFQASGPADRIYGSNNHLDNAQRYENAVILRGRWTDDATFSWVSRKMMER